MTYTVEPPAPASYDVLRDGALVASLVRNVHRDGPADDRVVESLDEAPGTERPPPFINPRHLSRSRLAALEWLGIVERLGSS